MYTCTRVAYLWPVRLHSAMEVVKIIIILTYLAGISKGHDDESTSSRVSTSFSFFVRTTLLNSGLYIHIAACEIGF